MNITMLHDLDTGFLAATLKPTFEALGHTCTVLQTLETYLEEGSTHIDILLKDLEDASSLRPIFKDTDLFFLRTVSDTTLKLTGVLPYITPHNIMFKIHGSELRERNVPYTLKTWRINWHNKEPLLCGPRDPSLFPLYRENTITHIERPCAFDTFPKRRRNKKQPFALTTPTNIERKGTQSLLDNWKSGIPLRVVHGVSRREVLKWKSQASYYIDTIGNPTHAGPYGMNSVEAWFYKIPVFSTYSPIDMVIEPLLPSLIHHVKENTVRNRIEDYIENKKQLNEARTYALHTHDPMTIAQQYINLRKELEQ